MSLQGSNLPPRRPLKMIVRHWLNRHSSMLTGGAIMIAVVGLAVAVALSPRPEPDDQRVPVSPGKAYFYDTVTGAYFTDLATRIPPITSPAGNVAVRAHFFTCGACDEDERFLGYYEKYTAKVKKRLEQSPEAFEFYEEAFAGRLYSKDGKTWIPAEDTRGFALIEKLQEKCPAKKLRYCPPN